MEAIKEFVNHAANPVTLYTVSVVGLLILILFTEKVVQPKVAGPLAGLIVLLFFFSLTDDHFRHIVMTPDNIPITIMLVSVGYLTWYALYKGVINDARIAQGKPPIEKEQDRRALVWPNLVYIEFICLILVSVLLIFWSIGFEAPLEAPANPTLTPNPSKAPWYFLGLQEMLVYYDPWLAGVVFPGLIVVGLMAIPFFDFNTKSQGYYTVKERRFAIGLYLFGFLIQWVLLIMLGTFMRGPGWNFFGPFEVWDLHKVEALTNINLSELIWVKLFHASLPGNILIREMFGFGVVFGYLFALPPLLAKTIFKKFYPQMTFLTYNIMCFLFLSLASLPIKMILRWSINLKYVVAIPEFFFNI